MAIQFFNGPLIHGKLRDENNRFRKLLAAGKPDDEIITRAVPGRRLPQADAEGAGSQPRHIAAKEDEIVALEDICLGDLEHQRISVSTLT